MTSSSRQRWFSHILDSGLTENIFGPDDVLGHVTTEIMANHLPPEVMSKVLQSSLAAGAMTPDRVLETLTPEVLAEHIPLPVLWKCVAEAAEKSGMTSAEGGKPSK